MYIILGKAKSEECRRIEGHGCSCDLGDQMIRVGIKEENPWSCSQGDGCGPGGAKDSLTSTHLGASALELQG